MKKLIILALIIMLFLAVNYKSGIDFATSIIPGWHTTIYPLWMILFFIVLLFLIIFGILFSTYYLFKKFLNLFDKNN